MNILKNFIVFEGLDGAGTTTQSKLLSEHINDSYLTCEPTSSDLGKIIRRVLQKEFSISPLTLAYLFVADRTEHVLGKNGIIEQCSKGTIVISDRYLFSSLAYQSLDVPFEKVLEINKDFPLPEILFFIDTSVEVCQERINKRSGKVEIFEDGIAQNKILENYKNGISGFEDSGMNIFYLNGDLSIEKLFDEEKKIIENIFTPDIKNKIPD